MSEEEKRRYAYISFALSLVLAFVLLVAVLCFLTINHLINWSDSRVTLITIPLLIGVGMGLFLGFFKKPKIAYLQRGEKVDRLDIIVSLLIGAILGLVFNSLMSFFSFSCIFLIIHQLFMGRRYLSNKY